MEDQPEELQKQLNIELSTPILNLFRKKQKIFLNLIFDQWRADY